MTQNGFPFRSTVAMLFVKIIIVIVDNALNVLVLIVGAALSTKFSNGWHSLGDALLIS